MDTPTTEDFQAAHIAALEEQLRTVTQEREAAIAGAVAVLENLRDVVLNQRGALAENGMTSEQVNDVLAEIDSTEDSIAAGRALLVQKERETIERCAKVCEDRAKRRWVEDGYTELDTNASYYPKPQREWNEAQDEEDENCADAIRSILPKEPA